MSKTVGTAKSTAEHGATLAGMSALFQSSTRVSASHAYRVAEPSNAQIIASVANWLAADTTGTPAQHAGSGSTMCAQSQIAQCRVWPIMKDYNCTSGLVYELYLKYLISSIGKAGKMAQHIHYTGTHWLLQQMFALLEVAKSWNFKPTSCELLVEACAVLKQQLRAQPVAHVE